MYSFNTGTLTFLSAGRVNTILAGNIQIKQITIDICLRVVYCKTRLGVQDFRNDIVYTASIT